MAEPFAVTDSVYSAPLLSDTDSLASSVRVPPPAPVRFSMISVLSSADILNIDTLGGIRTGPQHHARPIFDVR
jgi:hypothetical protein